MIAAAEVIFENQHGDKLLEWLAAELPKRVPFGVSRTEWRGFTMTIPQLRVETKPVALTIQLEEDEDSVPEENAELAEELRSRIAPETHAMLLRARSRLSVMSATPNEPVITDGTVTLVASTDLDPRSTDVECVLLELAELTQGCLVDLVHDRVRAPGSARWLSGRGGLMTKEGYAKWTLILSVAAAVLALSAALIEYVRQGEVNVVLIAAGLFLLAFGLGAKNRIAR